jgi:glycosyltransferase involved in cell wall biosynthesis
MLVSILMPSRNQARFLPLALDSALGQSHEPLEVLVMDGCSSDNSCEVLRNYAQRDGRLRWRSEPDGGPAEAVNKASKLARGKIIGWLNADDEYAPGAVDLALREFAANPGLKMLYGHAEFIDEWGETSGIYPTKTPDTPVEEFAQGCFICQPTVFIPHEAWQELGGLDESLASAFDFDLWIRAFQRWPERIGFLDRVLARSRTHAHTITHRNRKQVALEGLTVLARHLKRTPHEWVLTHFEEIIASHPDGQDIPLREKLEAFLEEARPCLMDGEHLAVVQRLEADRRVEVSGPHRFIGIHPDGWSGPYLTVRIDSAKIRGLQLLCENRPPGEPNLDLRVTDPRGKVRRIKVCQHGSFTLDLAAPSGRSFRDERLEFRIEATPSFRPSLHEGGTDHRDLCYQVLESKILS